MINVKRIGHITYTTPDLPRLVDFYTNVIGLSETGREAGRVIMSTRLGEEAAVFVAGAEAAAPKLSFRLGADADLAVIATQLAGERRTDVTPAIAEAVVFTDPFGTEIELFKHADNHGPQQVIGAAPLKFGHVAYNVPDAKVMCEFYTGTLGFRVSDWLHDFFVFMRCNADHHTVNFITDGGTARHHHSAYEVLDWAHMEQVCDNLGQHGCKIIWGPIRHGIGHNIALYHRDPDDRIIEFYTEIDQMKDEESGTFELRPWHRGIPQRPRVWTDMESAGSQWGAPPSPDFLRGTPLDQA